MILNVFIYLHILFLFPYLWTLSGYFETLPTTSHKTPVTSGPDKITYIPLDYNQVETNWVTALPSSILRNSIYKNEKESSDYILIEGQSNYKYIYNANWKYPNMIWYFLKEFILITWSRNNSKNIYSQYLQILSNCISKWSDTVKVRILWKGL